MKRLALYLKPFIPRMSLGLSVKILGTIVELAIPWILSHIIDVLIPIGEIKPVVFWGFLMILCSMLGWIGNITANRMASSVARDFTRNVRHDLFSKISYLSARQVDNFSIPSLISRMTSDTYVLHQTVGMIQRLGVRAPILLFGGIIVTLTLDPVLTLIMVATLPVVGGLTFYVSRKVCVSSRLYSAVPMHFCVLYVKMQSAYALSRHSRNPSMSAAASRKSMTNRPSASVTQSLLWLSSTRS